MDIYILVNILNNKILNQINIQFSVDISNE